jgi:predicted ABC-type transport system involved in lysophospholipase L1 biosynthesis ATPase subunit
MAPVIRLQSVGKVLLTDEVETHALAARLHEQRIRDCAAAGVAPNGGTICKVTPDPRYARHAQRTIHLFDGRVVDQRVERAAS